MIDAIPWDAIRPFTVLVGLMMNMPVQCTPLYHVELRARTRSLELLLGPDVRPEQLNDDAYGPH